MRGKGGSRGTKVGSCQLLGCLAVFIVGFDTDECFRLPFRLVSQNPQGPSGFVPHKLAGDQRIPDFCIRRPLAWDTLPARSKLRPPYGTGDGDHTSPGTADTDSSVQTRAQRASEHLNICGQLSRHWRARRGEFAWGWFSQQRT